MKLEEIRKSIIKQIDYNLSGFFKFPNNKTSTKEKKIRKT